MNQMMGPDGVLYDVSSGAPAGNAASPGEASACFSYAHEGPGVAGPCFSYAHEGPGVAGPCFSYAPPGRPVFACYSALASADPVWPCYRYAAPERGIVHTCFRS
jgi:hypothetical protein